jgi:Fe-S-cluster containining protein
VFLSETDVAVLASGLKISYTELIDRYCRWVAAGAVERLSLKEKAGFDCIFWDTQCVVYRYRPLQCRTFPFWLAVVSSGEAWDGAGQNCPGINNGELHSRQKIEACMAARSAEKVITRSLSGS